MTTTYYHRHASNNRFGPGERLEHEMSCPVLHIDVELDGEIIGPKRRLSAAELERARVRLGVNFGRPKNMRTAPEPDAWVFVSMRALRHEVRAAWRFLDAADESGDLTTLAMRAQPIAPLLSPGPRYLVTLTCVVALPSGQNINRLAEARLTDALCYGLRAQGVLAGPSPDHVSHRSVSILDGSMPDVERKAKRFAKRKSAKAVQP